MVFGGVIGGKDDTSFEPEKSGVVARSGLGPIAIIERRGDDSDGFYFDGGGIVESLD